MERYTPTGKERPSAQGDLRPSCALKKGYTLIELMIVMAIISVLVSIAVPLYQKALLRTKESLLKNNLFTMRTVIDEYTFDKKKAPQTLQDLVSEGLRRLLVNASYWALGMEAQIAHKSNVELVGEYKPTPFGFGSHTKGLKPADHALAR